MTFGWAYLCLRLFLSGARLRSFGRNPAMSSLFGRRCLGIRTSSQVGAWSMRVRCAVVIAPVLAWVGEPTLPGRSRGASGAVFSSGPQRHPACRSGRRQHPAQVNDQEARSVRRRCSGQLPDVCPRFDPRGADRGRSVRSGRCEAVGEPGDRQVGGCEVGGHEVERGGFVAGLCEPDPPAPLEAALLRPNGWSKCAQHSLCGDI